MENFEWDDKWNIGVEKVDKAHAKLFRIMKRLLELEQDENANSNTYREGIKYLEAYSMTHFLEEEAYMRSIGYSEYAYHKKIHDNFRDKTLVALKRDLERSGYALPDLQRFVNILKNWLMEHIMMEDQAIVGKVVPRRKKDHTAQVSILSKGVNKALLEVFQTEAVLVSDDYRGENIGNGFYCRQYYDMGGGVRLQLLLGVEELLLLRGVERIPGSNKMVKMGEVTDTLLLQVFGQLLQRLKKLFHIEKEYVFGHENLLTVEGFREEFMKGYACKLLFSTKSGGMVFCYRSWRVKGQGYK